MNNEPIPMTTTALLTPSIESLAQAINRAHRDARQYVACATERALEAGDLLIEVKAQLPHGRWLPWLKQHCPDISRRTAQNYMRVAARIPSEIRSAALLPSIRSALSLIAEPTKLDRETLYNVARCAAMGTILRDLKKKMELDEGRFLQFCAVALHLPEDLASGLISEEIYAASREHYAIYEQHFGEWDGWESLLKAFYTFLKFADLVIDAIEDGIPISVLPDYCHGFLEFANPPAPARGGLYRVSD